MAELRYLVGDATEPVERPAIIAHVCNDIGAWGAGFTAALNRRWPELGKAFKEYGRHPLGSVGWSAVAPEIYVANMTAQKGVGRGRRRIDDDALRTCLELVARGARLDGASVHMPRIGCGLAGATWDEIEPLVQWGLVMRGVDVYVYDLLTRPVARKPPAPIGFSG